MKIRTDFVTNSSSSSFVLSVKIDFNDGTTAEWEGLSDCGEGAYSYCLLGARKSPEELGKCGSIDELVDMLKTSIGQGEEWDEELEPVIDDDDNIIKKLNNYSSMDQIKSITIEGYEDTMNDDEDYGAYASDEIVTYDMKSKKQTAIIYGIEDGLECEGSGGSLQFERDTVPAETPDGWFDSKRDSLFESEDDYYGYDEDDDYDDDEDC